MWGTWGLGGMEQHGDLGVWGHGDWGLGEGLEDKDILQGTRNGTVDWGAQGERFNTINETTL